MYLSNCEQYGLFIYIFLCLGRTGTTSMQRNILATQLYNGRQGGTMISVLVSGSRGPSRAAYDIVPSKCPTPARCMNV